MSDWGRGDTTRTSHYPAAVRKLVHERTDGRCYWEHITHGKTGGPANIFVAPCNGPLQIDHLQPLSRGGDNHWTNLALACERHNKSKGNRNRP